MTRPPKVVVVISSLVLVLAMLACTRSTLPTLPKLPTLENTLEFGVKNAQEQKKVTSTTSPTDTPRPAVFVANCYFLTLRDAPNVNGRPINYLPVGTPVTRIGKCDSNGWQEIEAEAFHGFVNADYLSGGCQ